MGTLEPQPFRRCLGPPVARSAGAASATGVLDPTSTGSTRDTTTVTTLLRRPASDSAWNSQPLALDLRTRDRNPTEMLGHQSADSLDVFVLEIDVEQLA